MSGYEMVRVRNVWHPLEQLGQVCNIKVIGLTVKVTEARKACLCILFAGDRCLWLKNNIV